MNRVLVLAHGTARRWENFLGAPKQFVEIDGETLVARCCRLFQAAGGDVLIVGPDGLDWPTDVSQVSLDNPFPTGTEQDKFLATRHLWSQTGRTTIVWGDCFYTEEAVASIMGHQGEEPHCWRRPDASQVTGHKWDESFAVAFGAAHHHTVLQAAQTVADAVVSGRVRKDHIFMTLGAWEGVPEWWQVNRVNMAGGQTWIDDWTDDFDRPDEWTRWVGRYYRNRIRVGVAGAFHSDEKWRQRAHGLVDEIYRHSGLEPVWAGAKAKKFNISAARNAAFKELTERDPNWEVAIIADADTFVPPDQLWAAAYLARLRGHFTIAYDGHVRLTRMSTVRALDTLPKKMRRGITDWNDTMRVIGASAPKQGACHGVAAISRELWEQSGGYDERFIGWGGEDRAFWLTCGMLSGERYGVRIPGRSWHLWHPRPAEEREPDTQRLTNRDLAIRYKRAAGVAVKTGILPEFEEETEPDFEALAAILKERGGPWATMST